MKTHVTQKVAVITGAEGGIGSSLCRTFQNAGYFVIGTVLKRTDDISFCDAIIELDLNELASNTSVAEEFEATLNKAINGRHVKALINNAAVQILGNTSSLTAADFTTSFNVNVLAPFILAQLLLNDLTKSTGSILNIGTVHSQATKSKFIAYATTKTALHGLTRALAVDLGGKVRVNTLAPAATATPMLEAGFVGKEESFQELEKCHPIGRIASVDEISKTALFLCSDDASFITGTTLFADGGILSRLHDPA